MDLGKGSRKTYLEAVEVSSKRYARVWFTHVSVAIEDREGFSI